ncbi:MAG: hypothetical protein GY722_23775, partial [bacterium]|nr:hypothetical protein [bacterium]
MNSGDEMRNGDADSAVRILPNDDEPSSPLEASGSPSAHRWYIPVAVVAGIVTLFGVATRPGDPIPTTTTAPPARIADADAALVDLRTYDEAPIASEWVSAFEWNGQINDIVRATSSFIAVGSTPRGAQVWLSGTGSAWRLLQRLDRPDTPKSSIDRAVYRHGQIVALGSVDDEIGLWTANDASAWVYQGEVEPMGMNWITDLVSGPELMAVTADPDGGLFAWFSTNGIDWSEVSAITDLEGLVVEGFAADADHYYTFGQHGCAALACDPFIMRSADGSQWVDVGGDLLPDTAGGMVTDMVSTNDGLRAVGWAREGVGVTARVWESPDGEDWRSLPGAERIRETTITVEIATAGLEPSPWAQLVVAGTAIEVAFGSIIETDAGVVEVTGITADSVQLAGLDGRGIGIPLGETMSLTARPDPRHIAAEGPRMIITGYEAGTLGTVATAWLSEDGGANWAKQEFPDIRGDISAITAGASIVVYGEAGDSPVVWRNAWDTESAGYLAEDLVATYVNALSNRDAASLLSVLPRWDDNARPPQLVVPTLGSFEPAWWDTTTGEIISSRVEDTLDYMAGTEAEVRLAGCSSVVSLGVVDRVSVSCDYTADSALLSMFGQEGQLGKIRATLRDGRLSELYLEEAPSTPLWRVLANHVDPDVHRDGALATAHLVAAEEALGNVLRPGSTLVVDTVFGTMEWTWLESVTLGEANYVGSLTWSDLGFIAVGYKEAAVNPTPTVWNSPDGDEWTELPGPEQSEGIWDLKPFAGGVLGQSWIQGRPQLLYFDGSSWQEVAISPPESPVFQEMTSIAVSGDRALVMTSWWGEQDGLVHNAELLSPDLETTWIELPEALRNYEDGLINLTGTDDGFLVAVGGNPGARDDLAVWTTTDGTDWRLLTQTSSLDDAQFIWNLQEHRSRFFVVGDTLELRCASQEEESNCMNVSGLWSSTDGTEWDRVRNESGEPIETRAVGTGPLGLVAFGQEFWDTAYPRPIFVSDDGETWTTAGELMQLDANAEWWWSSVPAVGAETVIAAGTSYDA